MLLLAVLASAFYLVHVQYESRKVYTQLDRARSQAHKLEAEHELLQVQKRAEGTSARVQSLARQQLHMRAPNPAITQYATWSPAGAADENAPGVKP
jgi:cell division protein FtsL